jgi:catechol 2,3-dioxygenase-like lactoylglutathione lyase family enzyme
VEHIGVGVSDMDRSLSFYAELGFTQRAFDYEGELPGVEAFAENHVRARVVMLRAANETALGLGAVKLVQMSRPEQPPMPEGMAWGEPGVCEICVHARGQADVYRRLVDAGHTTLMEPVEAVLDPHGTRCSLSYVADPDGTKIELIEWLDLEEGWPDPPGPHGVNHVAFGAASIDATEAFYRRLGFGGLVFQSDGYFEPMHPWYAPREPPRQKMMLLTHPRGAGMEPVEHIPPSPDMRGQWGHLGPYEFGLAARNLEAAMDFLRDREIALLTGAHRIDLGGGRSWGYAYFRDPDENYVCLSESRY